MLGVALGAAVAGAVAHGAYYPNSWVFGRVLARLPRRAGVALTFDDGPNPDATPAILDALGEANVRAAFFILGRHAQRWPQLVRRVADEGHLVCNHGFAHRKLHLRGPRAVRDDIAAGTQAIVDACGVSPRYFRAPHGFRSPWVTRIAESFGQRTVGWSRGVWDSARPGIDAIVRRSVRAATPGAILLLHDGDGYDPAGDRMQTAYALPEIIRRTRERGVAFSLLDVA